MKHIIQIFVIAVSVFLYSNCASKTSALTENKIQNGISVNNSCQEWRRRYEELSENQKASFKYQGIILPNDYPYLLDENLVSDCALRIKIGDFIRKVISGTNDDNDKQFASENSKEIVRVIEAIWNSENFSVDGVSHEKYLLLLKETRIKDEDVAPFIGKLINEEKLNSEESDDEVFYVLFNRPLPNLDFVILDSLKQAEREKDLLGQVYASYLLFRNTSEQKYFETLKGIYKSEELSDAEKIELKRIIEKLERKSEINYDDFDNLSYAVENKKLLIQN